MLCCAGCVTGMSQAVGQTDLNRRAESIMNCFIYRSGKKEDTYVYIKTRDDFSDIPSDVLRYLGVLDFVMELDLATRDNLAHADLAEVMAKLTEQGFYIQLPPGD